MGHALSISRALRLLVVSVISFQIVWVVLVVCSIPSLRCINQHLNLHPSARHHVGHQSHDQKPCCGAVNITQARIGAAPRYWSSEDLGVHHYRLPGVLPAASFEGKQFQEVAVVLHLFLKATQSRSQGAQSLKVRGHGFAESVHWKESHYHLIQPENSLLVPWDIYLLGGDGARFNFTLHLAYSNNPFLLETEIPLHLLPSAAVVQLRVAGWRRYFEIALSQLTEHLQPGSAMAQWRARERQTHIIFVLFPFFGLQPSQAAALLMHSIRYHMALGLTSFLVYARPQMADYLIQDAVVGAAVQAGQLRIVQWDKEVSMHDEARAGLHYYDKPLVYNHALLAHFGEDTYLVINDVDEFLASFKPIDNLLSIVRGYMQQSPQARLGRLNAICSDCYAGQAAQSMGGDTMRNELQLWTDPGATEHPLTHYELMVTNHTQIWWPKSIVDPQAVYGMNPHFGLILGRDEDDLGANFRGNNLTMQPMPRLFFLHLLQLYSSRYDLKPEDDMWSKQTAWQWILDKLK